MCTWPEFSTENLFKAHWKDDGHRKAFWKYVVPAVYQPVYVDKNQTRRKEGFKGVDVYVELFHQTIIVNEDWFKKYGRYTDINSDVLVKVTTDLYKQNYIPDPEYINPEPIRKAPQKEGTSFTKKRARGAPGAQGAQRNKQNRRVVDEVSSDEEDIYADDPPLAQEDDEIQGHDEPEEDDVFYRITNTNNKVHSNPPPIFNRRALGKTTEEQYKNKSVWTIVKTLFSPVFIILQLNNSEHTRLTITQDELFGFFAIMTMMSIIKLESHESYFQTENDLVQLKFPPREYMSYNRFKYIRSKLQTYGDGDEELFENNRAWKVMHISTSLKTSFRRITLAPKQHLAMDEAMINYVGDKNPIKTTIPGKPNNGIRLFCLVEVETKIMIDFNLDDKTDDADNCRHIAGGFTGHQVLKLLSEDGVVKRFDAENLIVYIDNYYTSPHLMRKLLDMGIRCIGTIKKQRLPTINTELSTPAARQECPEFKPAATQCRPTLTNPRGTVKVARTHTGENSIFIYSVMDSALFFMADTAYGPFHKEMMLRRSGGNVDEYEVPKAVNVYNKYMNGVDVVDQLSWGAFNPTKHRTNRWTFRYLEALWGLTITNAYSIYKQVNQDNRDLGLSHAQFRRRLVDEMFSSPEVQRLKAGHVTRGKIRQIGDVINNVGERCILSMSLKGSRGAQDTRRERKTCQGQGKRHQTSSYCVKCQIYICEKCFHEFHDVQE